MIRQLNHSNYVRTILFVGLMVLGLAAAGPVPVWATDAVVGDGTPASCTEAEFDSKLDVVQKSGDGELSFNCGGPATIIFREQKVIDSNLVIINGGGVITLSGGNTNRLFHVVAGAFELRNIALTNGFSGDGYGGAVLAEQGTSVYIINSTIQNSRTGWGFAGGAILSFATLTTIPAVSIENSTIQGNESFYSAVNTVGKLVVSDSLIQNNTGGGLSVGGPTIITNTDFEGNEAASGGAFFATTTADVEMTGGQIINNNASFGGAIFNEGNLALTDVTISGNYGDNAGSIWNNGDVFLNRSTIVGNEGLVGVIINAPLCPTCRMLIRNTTIANNIGGGEAIRNHGMLYFQYVTLWHNTTAPNEYTIFNVNTAELDFQETLMGGEVGKHCGGDPAASSDFSLFEDYSCDWQSGSGNIVEPYLTMGPLGPHGGLTETMIPPEDSPAIDAAQCHLSEDQRGVSRPQGAACDIGSVERRLDEGDSFSIYLPIIVN